MLVLYFLFGLFMPVNLAEAMFLSLVPFCALARPASIARVYAAQVGCARKQAGFGRMCSLGTGALWGLVIQGFRGKKDL